MNRSRSFRQHRRQLGLGVFNDRVSTITVTVSADGTATNSEPVFTQHTSLALQPSHARIVHLRLTAAQVTSLQAGAGAILVVTDAPGGAQTLALSGL